MKFYRIKDDYIAFLKNIESKIPDNYSEKRAYVGIVLTIGIHQYFAPLSSYKPYQDRMKKNDTIFKLHAQGNENDKLGLIHLNNMFPILPSEITEIVFKDEPQHYANLLRKQYRFILSNSNDIMQQAQRLYKRVVERKAPFYVQLSCDFKLLEQEYIKYNK